MKKKRFSFEQIVAVLKQAELGMPVADLIRHFGADVLSLEDVYLKAWPANDFGKNVLLLE